MSYLAGIDIGGTKCAVSIGKQSEIGINVLYKEKFPTPDNPKEAVNKLVDTLEHMINLHPETRPEAIGISCGSPLDSQKGVVLSPPNLPNWDRIDVVTPFIKHFEVRTAVQNDANACALAEWLFGAGKGCENMIFLTFGIGLGAGLILNGRLYSGTCDMAGEVGHVRLENNGPKGYGKAGSFEGFCSGGGIAHYAADELNKWLEQGRTTIIADYLQSEESVTAAQIGLAAERKDELALKILHDTGRMLGKGIAMLIDILNPQKIVIGSIFLRQESFLRGVMEKAITEEALSVSRSVCEVVPAALGEELGDYAALSVAGNLILKG